MSHTPTTLYDNQLKVDTYIFYEKNVNPTTLGLLVKSAPIFSYCKCVKSAPFCAKSAPFCVKSAPFCVKSAPFLCQICTFFVSNLHHLCQICTFCVKSAPFLLYNILNYILALAGGHYKYKTFALAPAGSCRPNLTQHKDVLHQIFLGFFERKKVQI